MAQLQVSSGAVVAIAASFTAEPMLPALRFILGKAGLAMGVECAPYHQVFQELLSGDGLLSSNEAGVNLILVRLEDFLRDVKELERAQTVLFETTRDLTKALEPYAKRAQVPTVFVLLKPSPRALAHLFSELEEATESLGGFAQPLPGIHVVTSDEVDRVSCGEKYDDLRDDIAHIPFTEEYYASIALAVARKIHALRVPALKVLALDCDNTLWRGVVGEDGVQGISIPRPLLSVQRFAVREQSKGTLLCLASKNSEQDVLDVFAQRSDMALRLDHVLALRVNWLAKSANLESLARQFGLGLDSFVFLDDSPIECAEMRAALPEVLTLQLPPEEEIEKFLSNLWAFDKLTVTAEDQRRTSMYRENAARDSLEESTTNIAEFIASLELFIDISPPRDDEWPRVAQLTHRTNQFNFTTLRRSEAEIRALQSSGSSVLRVCVHDRFGDYGLVGVIISHTADGYLLVDTFLLSCRVLGRGVEHAMLRTLGEVAEQRRLPSVHLPFRRTSKNEPALAFSASVVASYGVQEHDGMTYKIPVEFARTIVHRPGGDPDAVIKARRSESLKRLDSDLQIAAPSVANRSDRYTSLARHLSSGGAVLEAMRSETRRARSLSTTALPPKGEVERRLMELWKELLNIDALGVEDDYFALGGNSVLAARMFAEISRRFGIRLPITTILELSTVRALGQRITSQGSFDGSKLLELKSGGDRKFFLVHDGDGETLLYLNLARRMPAEISVIGVGPRRIARVPLAHTRIEEMAGHYLTEVRKEQPSGPYMLGGLCAGGVIAYEMALQLRSAGEQVKLLAILDAAAPRAKKRSLRITRERFDRLRELLDEFRDRRESFGRRAYLLGRATLGRVSNILVWEFSSRTRRASSMLRFHLLRMVLACQWPWPSFLPELTVREIYDWAEARYFPKPLSNSGVLLVRARAGEDSDVADIPYREIYASDELGWDDLISDVGMVDVEGGHASMLQEPFIGSLAAALIPRVLESPQPIHPMTR